MPTDQLVAQELDGAPGPGAYAEEISDQTRSTPGLVESVPPRSAAAGSRKGSTFAAKKTEPRIKKELEIAPGPGQYRTPSSFNVQKKPENLQFFGSTADRFGSTQTTQRLYANPGPGYASRLFPRKPQLRL